jgi:glucokinase
MPGGLKARRLVADVGGSNVRFALVDRGGALERIETRRVADHPSFAAALADYFKGYDHKSIEACAIAAAGPVDESRIKLTNNAWTIDRGEISAVFGGSPVVLLNDLEAVAAALPHLGVKDWIAVGGPAATRPERRTMLALNVGTGLGAASAAFRDARWTTIPSEAGHMTLGPLTVGGVELADDGASVESVLSGPGVVELYGRVAAAQRKRADTVTDAAQVFARANDELIAARTVELLTLVLARVAGDLALATAAWGGVYFCGSVATAWVPLADTTAFRAEFIRKGLMQTRLENVPTVVILREQVALYGLATIPISS